MPIFLKGVLNLDRHLLHAITLTACFPAEATTVQEIVTGMGLHERPSGEPTANGGQRPHVVLNMVATLDGRATLGGRSGPISDDADRALFHGLRSVVDAVMAGAGTVRAERYGPIVRDPDTRRLRRERGLREQPLACVVSAGLGFPPDLPLLCDPDSEVAFLTPSRGESARDRRPRAVRARAPRGRLARPPRRIGRAARSPARAHPAV